MANPYVIVELAVRLPEDVEYTDGDLLAWLLYRLGVSSVLPDANPLADREIDAFAGSARYSNGRALWPGPERQPFKMPGS